MKYNTKNEVLKVMYDAFLADAPWFAEDYPTIEDWAIAINEPNDLVMKTMYDAFLKDAPWFAEDYPEWEGFTKQMGVEYSDQNIADIKDAALTDLAAQYKGSNFDTLIKNKDNIGNMIKTQDSIINDESIAFNDPKKIDAIKDKKRLSKAFEFVTAYTDIENADTDDTINNLFDQSQNKYLSKVMPTARYKAMEIPEGLDIREDYKEILLPEYSRRTREGESGLSSTLGAAKDVLRIPGRAIRTGMANLMNIDDPSLTMVEEFAKPDRYKSGAEETLDEFLGLQGVVGAGAKSLATKAAPTAISKIPLVKPALQGLNKKLNFVDPKKLILGGAAPGGGKSSILQGLAKGGARNAPEAIFDVGFEATREDDMYSDLAPLLAGVFGIAPGMIAGGKAAKTPHNIADEIATGSKDYLIDQLQLAKALDLGSAGTSSSLGDLTAAQKDIFDKLKASADGVDNNLAITGPGTSEDVKRQLTEISEGLAGKRKEYGAERKKLYPEIDAILQGRAERLSNSPNRLMPDAVTSKMIDMPSTYRRKIAGQEIAEQDDFLRELTRSSGLDLADASGALRKQAKDLLKLQDLPQQEYLDAMRTIEAAGPIELQALVDNQLAKQFKLTPEQIAGSTGSPSPKLNTLAKSAEARYPFGTGEVKMPEISEIVEGRTDLRELASKKARRAKGDASVGIFGEAEQIQKEAMEDLLKPAGESGKNLIKSYEKFAKNYNLQDQLPPLADAKLADAGKIDTFISKMATSRYKPERNANMFNEYVALQQKLNKELGKEGDEGIDFITNSVMNQLTNRNWLKEMIPPTKVGFDDMIPMLLKAGKNTVKGWITSGNFGAAVANYLEGKDRPSPRDFISGAEPIENELDKRVADLIAGWNKNPLSNQTPNTNP